MTITFTGASSVADRTIFTYHGPIVKSPVPILAGNNLYVTSPLDVLIPTGSFTSSVIGKTITISGSPGGRNDGTFYITAVNGPTKLRLRDVSLNVSNIIDIEKQLVELVNDLKSKYNAHRIANGIHGSNDLVNIVVSPTAVDINSSILLLNEIRSVLYSHSITVQPPHPPVHSFPDPNAVTFLPEATNVKSAVELANELRKRFETHRQDRFFHLKDDFTNRITVLPITETTGSGPMVGPFSWILSDPRDGQIADDPSDVSVLVNSLPVAVESVFGLLGAVVLSSKPGPADSVLIDYKYINNPPTQFERLNSFEFVLNQEGNRGISGVPKHLYRQRSYLIDPKHADMTIRSPFQPMKVGWKYKGFERKYTACLNDPNSLLLNVPTNKIMFPILNELVFETIVRYDPTSLPQNSTDPWVFNGSGIVTVSSDGLVIQDTGKTYDSTPPFYSHAIDLTYDSEISAAYRFNLQSISSTLVTEGCFTGVGFGIIGGSKAAVVGCVLTNATNLTSAIVLVNDIKAKFNSHLVNTGIHIPNDNNNGIEIVDATSLDSLVILANYIKKFYTNHISKGPNNVHLFADAINTVTSPDAIDLDTSIRLVNELRNVFNLHLTQTGIHYHNDTINTVNQVRQVGILTSSGFIEEENSWTAFAHDWEIETTYRLYRDYKGNVGLYLSGDLSPRAYVVNASLPDASSLDLKLNTVYETFFGSIGDMSTSTSKWKFARVDINPIDSVQISKNKSVDYVPVVLPELDPDHPWITIGQGGYEHVDGSLTIGSTASVSNAVANDLGILTGEYRGFLRVEPSLNSKNTISFEFTTKSSFYSSGIDNRSLGVHIGDGNFATQLCFLQSSPLPATVTGTVKEPFPIVGGDVAVFSINNGPSITVTALAPTASANDVCNLINASAGYVFATPSSGSPSSIKLTTQTFGSSSSIRIIGGSIFEKLGIKINNYFGSDTKPESKISWIGSNLPNLVSPPWYESGNQPVSLLERTLRITDLSPTGYKSYTISDPTVTSSVISASSDWKADFRLRVLSFIKGGQIVSGPNLSFCGALMSIDEGPSGKNIELHLSADASNNPYIGVYSFNPVANELDYVGSFPFTWNDGKEHSYGIFTSKSANLILIFADDVFLGSFAYPAFSVGIYGPSLTFGSGSNEVTNADLRSSSSVVDWKSVCCISDKKLADPLSASNRYVGLYKGGDPSVLSSYYLTQVDWTSPHTFRIVRDQSSVSVFMDGISIPVISAGYDVLTLPITTLDFLSGVVPSGKFVAFGSFSSSEIVKSNWGSFSYSIGNSNFSDGIIPSHNVLNQSNVIASSEHLKTNINHDHFGTTSYSGGTPSDDFMSNADVPASTVLGEGTPPIPMSQNLRSPRDFITTATPIETVSSVDFVNNKGQIAHFENDTTNVVNYPAIPDPLLYSISLANGLLAKFSNHVIKKSSHIKAYPIGRVTEAFDLPTLIVLSNYLKSQYETHRIRPGVHASDDTVNSITALDATDLVSAQALVNDVALKFNNHRTQTEVHASSVIIRLDVPGAALYNDMKFYTFPSGTPNYVASISDDETLYVSSSVDFKNSQKLSYSGNNMPEMATIVGSVQEPFNIVEGDVLKIVVNLGNPITVVFSSIDTSLTNIINRINTYTGEVTASDNGDGRVRLTETIGSANSRIEVSGNAAVKLGLDSGQSANWKLLNFGPSDTKTSIESDGINRFLQFGTTGIGTLAVYSAGTGLTTQPSLNFSAKFKIRISSWSYGPDGDTGIYAGVSGITDSDFVVAIGFVDDAGVKTVILKDMKTMARIASRIFNWADGGIHEYLVVKSGSGDISLEVMS